MATAAKKTTSRIGRAPLVPSWVPPGFGRVEVGVAKRWRATGDEQRRNPVSQDVVSIRYRRGLDELVMTNRLTGPKPSAWGEPVVRSSPMGRRPQEVGFAKGALEGRRGELVIDANSVPHVWVVGGPLVITVAGNLDAASSFTSPSRSTRSRLLHWPQGAVSSAGRAGDF